MIYNAASVMCVLILINIGGNGVNTLVVKSKITDDAYVNQTYNMAQVGYDTLRGDWTVGGALLYGTSIMITLSVLAPARRLA